MPRSNSMAQQRLSPSTSSTTSSSFSFTTLTPYAALGFSSSSPSSSLPSSNLSTSSAPAPPPLIHVLRRSCKSMFDSPSPSSSTLSSILPSFFTFSPSSSSSSPIHPTIHHSPLATSSHDHSTLPSAVTSPSASRNRRLDTILFASSAEASTSTKVHLPSTTTPVITATTTPTTSSVATLPILPSPSAPTASSPDTQVVTWKTHLNATYNSLAARKFEITRDFITGGIAGAVSRTAVAPLERLKIMFMCGGSTMQGVGVVKALRDVYSKEGVTGFFRGNGANVVRIFPFSAISLSTYPLVKSILTNGDRDPITPTKRFWCGVTSGVMATFATYPLDLVRCRLSMQSTDVQVYKGVVDCMIKIYREEGFRRLYTGLQPTLLGIIPYSGIQLASYDLMRDWFPRLRGNEKADSKDFFVAGGLSGMLAQTAAFPIELVRRRMQVRGFAIAGVDAAASQTNPNASFVTEFMNVFKAHGIRGLYRGLWPNYLKIAPAAGVHFLVFEKLKKGAEYFR